MIALEVFAQDKFITFRELLAYIELRLELRLVVKEPLANNRLRRLGFKELDRINEIHSLSFRMTKETKT